MHRLIFFTQVSNHIVQCFIFVNTFFFNFLFGKVSMHIHVEDELFLLNLSWLETRSAKELLEHQEWNE